MKAMILAAGRGERMRPLTDTLPKPLLEVNGKPLIVYHIEKLVAAGIKDIVINHAWLGEKIPAYLGNGSQYGANITYSAEINGALETAGGIAKALPLLDQEAPFIVVNGDVFTDYDFNDLPSLASDKQAHLVLVNNPEHNASGDFLCSEGVLLNKIEKEMSAGTFTFSGIAIYRASFFKALSKDSETVQALGPMLRNAAQKSLASASVYQGSWTDVGTPERLAKLNQLEDREC